MFLQLTRRSIMAMNDQFVARLTAEQRQELHQLATPGQRPAATLTRARILLTAGVAAADGADERRAVAPDTSPAPGARVRKKLVQQGLPAAVQRQRPTGRQYRKLDGVQEAPRAAGAGRAPPVGQARWTMKLLADPLVTLAVVAALDPATVGRTLKKTKASRG
jgi:hypothetical protein